MNLTAQEVSNFHNCLVHHVPLTPTGAHTNWQTPHPPFTKLKNLDPTLLGLKIFTLLITGDTAPNLSALFLSLSTSTAWN